MNSGAKAEPVYDVRILVEEFDVDEPYLRASRRVTGPADERLLHAVARQVRLGIEAIEVARGRHINPKDELR